MIKLISVAIIIFLIISSCASVTPSTSYAASLSTQDAYQVAQSLTQFLSGKLPPANTTLNLAPPLKNPQPNGFTQQLIEQLRQAGFAISSNDSHISGHSLRYLVTSSNDGILLRFELDNTQFAKYYPRVNQHLQSNGTITQWGGEAA